MDADIVRRPPFGSNPLVGERGSDTRNRILDAALEVFGEVPYTDAGVELITARAGCSRPAFYQYFSSKDAAFWALAGQLSHEMVGLAKRLERVTPDADGLAHLTAWIDEFMGLHEAWAPVFNAFPAASREHSEEARDAVDVSDATGRALLKAFGVRASNGNRAVARLLVALLIRSSFFAEHAPAGTDRSPMARGLARQVHRTLAGPLVGVNLRPGRPRRRTKIRVLTYHPPEPRPPLGRRGERTRRQLLDAGAKVLPARGYHDARVDDVVEAAGVSHGTFYRYFANKDDFFRVLAEEAATRLIELVDRLRLDAPPADLRAWLDEWFEAYEADGGVISTWQEMRASPALARFSQEVAAAVFTRLERELDRRDFGEPPVAAATLLALIERGPYTAQTLGFLTREQAVDAMVSIIRRGFLALGD
jgi:AcrR family transcriptional regulator